MKKLASIIIVGCLFFISLSSVVGQSDVKHIAIDDFPKDMVINNISGWGNMTVAVNEMPAGTDFDILLEGLKDNMCPSPHWGYIIKGVLKMKYADGTEQILKEGDLFYMPPGHSGVVVEDLKMMDFSPSKPMAKVVSHIEYKVAEMSKGNK